MSSIKRAFRAGDKPGMPLMLAVAAGVLMAASLPGAGLWGLAWVGLIPACVALFHGLAEPDGRLRCVRAAQLGGLFGFIYHGLAFSWLFGLHPLTWMGFSPAQSLVASFLAWGLATLWGALFSSGVFWAVAVATTGVFRLPKLLWPLVFALCWVLGFQAYAATVFGVPLALLHLSQHTVVPMRELAPVIGLEGITAVLVFHNALWALLWVEGRQKTALCLATLVPLAMAFPLIPDVAAQRERGPGHSEPLSSLPLVIIQGNLPIDVVRSPERARDAAGQAYGARLRDLSFSPGTLVALPEEGAVPDWVTRHAQDTTLNLLRTVSRQKTLVLLSGASTVDPERRKAHNSLVLVTPDGQVSYYHKRRLVPFGEDTPYIPGFLPEDWLAQLLGWVGVAYGDVFSPGPSAQPLLAWRDPGSGKTFRAGGLVCFELAYPGDVRRYRDRKAQLVVVAANLGWFHGHPGLERAFLAAGQMAAAEARLPVAIAANTGISAVIDKRGNVLWQAPSGRAMVGRTGVALGRRVPDAPPHGGFTAGFSPEPVLKDRFSQRMINKRSALP